MVQALPYGEVLKIQFSRYPEFPPAGTVSAYLVNGLLVDIGPAHRAADFRRGKSHSLNDPRAVLFGKLGAVFFERPAPLSLGLTERSGNAKKLKQTEGGMAEWFKAAVLKTAFPPGNGGSNPSPSANR